nr:ABC transporter ATP-binding protein [Treponema socranskii]
MEEIQAIDSIPLGQDILSMQNITKIYSNGFIANQDITFSVRKGDIHGLVGENGAGKTTLMKVLFGQEIPERGKILVAGREVQIKSPLQALAIGIGMVHQHFMLINSLSVAENMVLGTEPVQTGIFFDYKKAITLTKEISKKYDLPIDPEKKIKDISVGYKQRVEILKILLRGAKILLLDEPTAVLTPQETKELFTQLKSLKNKGYTIIFISHKLNEVKEICDRITVLRHGKTVGSANVSGVTEKDIARMMVGRNVILDINKKPAEAKKVVLSVRQLKYYDRYGSRILNDLSFDLRQGEILGIAGVEGNGQAEIGELISGLEAVQSGSISIDGNSIQNKSIRQIREMGVSLIHEDRMAYGVAKSASVLENIISERFYKREYQNRGLIRYKQVEKNTDDYIKEFNIKCDSPYSEVKTLSGGNIQKVVAAREFTSTPKVVLASHPTRGIDIGATELIRRKMVDLRDKLACGILLISADLNEILTVSDSIIVLYEGEITAYFPNAKDTDENILGEYMLGIKRQTSEEIGRVIHDRT